MNGDKDAAARPSPPGSNDSAAAAPTPPHQPTGPSTNSLLAAGNPGSPKITVTMTNSVPSKLNNKMKSMSVGGVALVPKTPVPGLAAALQASGVPMVELSTATTSPSRKQPQPQHQPLSPALHIPSIPPPPPPPPLKGLRTHSRRSRSPSPSPSHSPSPRSPALHPPKVPNLVIPTPSNKGDSRNPQLTPPPLPPNSAPSQSTPALWFGAGGGGSPSPSGSPRTPFPDGANPLASNPNVSLPGLLSPTSVSAAQAELAAVERALQKRARALQGELREIESGIAKREDEYIAQTWAHGNVIRGWDNFVRRAERAEAASGTVEKSSKEKSGGAIQGSASGRKARVNDHIFSLSSSTSKVRKEHPDAAMPKRTSVAPKRKKKRG